jgi:branched-chain amino acid transport system ATP-binding protein
MSVNDGSVNDGSVNDGSVSDATLSGSSTNGASANGSQPLLKVEDLVVRYGQIEALHGLSLEVYPGEVVALIGSNGAGKSTTLRAISGVVRPAGGRVLFDGRDVTGLPSHQIVRLGLGHVPEGRQVFANQSVRDNLLLGAYPYARDRGEVDQRMAREMERFPVLAERQGQLAGTLSGGEQQMLAISRGLMSRPRMLLMDEPSMGLAPLIVMAVAETIKALNKEGVTILLVEQMATMALHVADRAYVIQNGAVRMEGSSASLASNPDVIRAYLGGAAQHG